MDIGCWEMVCMSMEASCIANEVILALATFFQHQRGKVFSVGQYVLNTAIHHFLEIGLLYLPTLRETYHYCPVPNIFGLQFLKVRFECGYGSASVSVQECINKINIA